MWLKLPNNANPVYITNELHSLKSFDLDDETFLKYLDENNIKNEIFSLDNFSIQNEDKAIRKIAFLSRKNKKKIIFLTGEGRETLLTKLQYKELSCPIFISSSNAWVDHETKRRLNTALVKQKGKNILQMFFNKQTFKKSSNILLSIFSGLAIIFSYAYGAFSTQYREDSLYQYISKSIIESNYPCGHATYESESSTYSSMSQLNSSAVRAGNSLYTNFDVGESTDIKKRTYVATYIQINNSDSMSFSFEGIDFSPSPLTLSDWGYALDKDDSQSTAYGRFFSVSLYRYKYIATDWVVKEDFDAPIYISQFTADTIINQSDTIESYDDLIGKEIEANIDGITLNCFIANIILNRGQATYLSSFYQDFCFIQISSFSSKDSFRYSFCFDPSTSYVNIKTIASPSYIASWIEGDVLKFYIRDKNTGGYIFLSEFSRELTSLYDGNEDTITSAIFLITIILLLMVNITIVGATFYKKIKQSKGTNPSKITFFDSIETFIFLSGPILIIQLFLHIVQLLLKNNIQSFFIFNYFGANFSTIYFIVLLFLLIFSLILFSNNNSPKKPKEVIRNDFYEIDV